MIGLPTYCLACDRQLAPLAPAVADRNQRRHVHGREPTVRLPVVLGALWVAAVLGLPAGLGFVVAWAWSP